jgi:hypothetical protein
MEKVAKKENQIVSVGDKILIHKTKKLLLII